MGGEGHLYEPQTVKLPLCLHSEIIQVTFEEKNKELLHQRVLLFSAVKGIILFVHAA